MAAFSSESALWTDLIELAAVATVADVVPLVGENREIVRRGLKKIANTSLVGLRALIQSATREGSPITSDTIGFGIGPRINAAGRLDDAMLAVKLLITSDSEEAKTFPVNSMTSTPSARKSVSASLKRQRPC